MGSAPNPQCQGILALPLGLGSGSHIRSDSPWEGFIHSSVGTLQPERRLLLSSWCRGSSLAAGLVLSQEKIADVSQESGA